MLLSVNISCANTRTLSLEKLCGTVAVGTVPGSREALSYFVEQVLSPEKLTGGTVPFSREAVPVWWRYEYLFLPRVKLYGSKRNSFSRGIVPVAGKNFPSLLRNSKGSCSRS
jgi:hypothetical protein